MRGPGFIILALGLGLCGPAGALELNLPASATALSDERTELDSYDLPIAPYAGGQMPVISLEGHVSRQSWRVATQGLTSLQLLTPLREQLQEAGYDILFECDTLGCGGFDFRFETEVLPAPSMHVDLGDFRFLSARNGPKDHLGLLVSHSANAGFIQLIRVTDTAQSIKTDTNGAALAQPSPPATVPGDTIGLLVSQGHVVLDDLAFKTGSSTLDDRTSPSLQALADFLLENPVRRVALVGHTDAVGALDNNIALSKKRAASVLERLVSRYNVPRGQLSAEGMGYLAPIAPNQTEEGREANRRVEAVLLNTE
ncbi:OmpA family protein [Thalassovita aquimarina]|uniref:OmpA family protein n=1 Tax=Thalassovita aquimarina TaxID=2785917 RepID=A0ABS5HMA0_9RHOB|nr:OmpA family protein [Thalassovita aquimarina]MBR9650057.1 OmpA family protein [Thalassovita aquimarina]